MLAKIFLLTFVHASLQLSNFSSPTYEAGVVEFNYANRLNLPSADQLRENLNEYLKFMEAAPDTLDILVFPELTLNNRLTAVEIPEPEDEISPCDSADYPNDNLVKIFSCAARKYNRYTVINIITKAKCPDSEMIANEDPRECETTDGYSYYNTNVVFDRVGVVISRYRKFHLFGENVHQPHKPPMTTFHTDFGVTFGIFTCFDIHFRYPAVELVRSYNVTDVIFPMMWFSGFPFLSAVQVAQNWAHSLDVNMLAAGANFPARASTGTGIFGGKKGAYVAEMHGSNRSKLYAATVYKKIPENAEVKIKHQIHRHTKEAMSTLDLWRDQLDVFSIQFLTSINGNNRFYGKLCRNKICCNYKINYNIQNSRTTPHYQYAVAFHHGTRSFSGIRDAGVVVCAVIACPQREKASCGYRNETLENIHIWNSIEIYADLPTTDGQYLYMPTSLDTSILPLQPEQFAYTAIEDEKNERINITMKLSQHAENLLSFGIWGRDYNLDD